MNFVQTGDIVTHYQIDGDAGKPLLVFANSLGTDFRTWDEVVQLVSPRFRCLRYDKRGHGMTTLTDGAYTMDQLVGDLTGLLDTLDLEATIVCGLSVGGMIAQRLAATHPDRTKGLVLCDTAMVIGTHEVWDDRIGAIEAQGMEAVADPTMERWFSARFLRDEAVHLSAMRTMLTRTPPGGYIGVSHAIRNSDLTEGTSGLTHPTLCIGGDEDGATPPELMAKLAGAISGARHEIMTGVGHLPCVEQPAELAKLILDFAELHKLG